MSLISKMSKNWPPVHPGVSQERRSLGGQQESCTRWQETPCHENSGGLGQGVGVGGQPYSSLEPTSPNGSRLTGSYGRKHPPEEEQMETQSTPVWNYSKEICTARSGVDTGERMDRDTANWPNMTVTPGRKAEEKEKVILIYLMTDTSSIYKGIILWTRGSAPNEIILAG